MLEIHGISPIGKDTSRQPRKRRQQGDQREPQSARRQGPAPKRPASESKSLIVDLEA